MSDALETAIADYTRMLGKASMNEEKKFWQGRLDLMLELKELRDKVKQNRAVVAKLRRR